MKFRVEKSFDRDIDKVKDKKLLQKIHFIISRIEKAAEIKEMPHVKKIKGFSSFYRIKIGITCVSFFMYKIHLDSWRCINSTRGFFYKEVAIEHQYRK